MRLLSRRIGEIPLPPYISREQPSRESPEDAERYQTIYARVPGSAAAPTAGLHLEAEAIEQLEAAGIEHTPKGVEVDRRLRPSNKRVFDVGDIAVEHA